MIRLDKFLCSACIGSRKEVKEIIRLGKVKVDGMTVTKPDFKMDEASSKVSVNGKEMNTDKYTYILMNKPKGVICAAKDANRRTVFDVLPEKFMRKGLYTVGRLDKDTTGLLIITNDGEFGHALLSPSKHVEKEYYAEGTGRLAENACELFEKGISLGQLKLKPGKLKVLSSDEYVTKVIVTISEGKYHQVKRMLYEVGIRITELKRIKFGGLVLDPSLKEGEARFLTSEEVEFLSK